MDERTSRFRLDHRSGVRARVIAAVVFALLALGAWSLASPVGSSPDEDFHLSSVWCGLGERDAVDGSTVCAPGNEADEQSVAVDLVDDAVCHAFQTTKDASCQGEDFGERPSDVVSTDRGNFDGLYPGGFYAVMSVFAGGDIETSVLLMRAVNVLLFTGLITLAAVALPRHLRPVLLASTVVSTLSLGTFLIASINPSGWAVLSGAIVFPAALGFLELRGRGWRRIALGALAALGVLMAAGARSDAAIFAIVGLALAVWFAAERTRGFVLAAILPVALMVPAAISFLVSGQSGAVSAGIGAQQVRSPGQTLLSNLLAMPHLWGEAVGGSKLGWLDTPMPQVVVFAGVLCFTGAIVLGSGLHRPRKWPALLGVAAAIYLVPLYVLMQDLSLVGENVQARYILPLMTVLAAVALLQQPDAAGRAPWRPTPMQSALAVLVLSAANAVALFTTVRRYTVGAGTDSLLDGPQWWWDGAVPGPLVVVAIGSAAYFALLATLAWPLLRPKVGPEGGAHPVFERRAGSPSVGSGTA